MTAKQLSADRLEQIRADDAAAGPDLQSSPPTWTQRRELLWHIHAMSEADLAPIPMLLWCPACGQRHVDEGQYAEQAHHTHACQSCGMVWRPALVATVGVQFLPGFKNVSPYQPPHENIVAPAVIAATSNKHADWCPALEEQRDGSQCWWRACKCGVFTGDDEV